MVLRTRVVDFEEWQAAHSRTGSVYFIRDDRADMVKIGHSRNPWRRLSELQVGSANRLAIVGVIAADIAIEGVVHQQFSEGHSAGEWFWDRLVLTDWLRAMTAGYPFCRNVWSLE